MGLLYISNRGAQHLLAAAVMSVKQIIHGAIHNLFIQNHILFQKGSNEAYTNTYTGTRQNDLCKMRKRETGQRKTECRKDKLSWE